MVFYFPKNDMAKSMGPFDIRNVLIVKNMQKKNKEIYFAVLKPNERGVFRKPLESMVNKSRSL
jgi:hypothetical protein